VRQELSRKRFTTSFAVSATVTITLLYPQKPYIYVAQEVGPGLEAVLKPRNREQCRNAVKNDRRQNRLTHDELFNVYELTRGLGDFVQSIHLFPTLNVYMLSNEMLQHVSDAFGASTDANVQLLYDTTYQLGNFYFSILCMRMKVFEGDPVVPIAVYMHDRLYASDHHKFFEFMMTKCPELRDPEQQRRLTITTDREFRLQKTFRFATLLYC